MKQQEFMYSGLGERLKKEWKIYLAALIFIIIADSIGQIKIPLGPGTLILFPIFYSIFLGILSGPQILKIFKKPEVKAASKLVIVCICPFIAKLGINAGASIETVISAGPALLLQEFGNLGTIFLSLLIALLLGLKREAVGACHSINRETNLALMQDVFGPDSPEARGSLSIYIIGGMVGTIFFGFMATVIAYCSLIGLLVASPLCPAREFVIEAAGKINFTAPLTMVGAYAGISISDQLKEFAKQGWKMLLIAALVMIGTFTCSAIIAQIVLSLTHVI